MISVRVPRGLLLLTLGLSACQDAPASGDGRIPGGNAERGRALVEAHGCGSCHRIDGIAGADGVVGPPLDRFARGTFIAGELPNVPSVLVPWLQDPARYSPGTGMPDVGLDQAEARDIATWLYRRTDAPSDGRPENVLVLEDFKQALKQQTARDRKRLDGDGQAIPIEEAMEQVVRNGS